MKTHTHTHAREIGEEEIETASARITAQNSGSEKQLCSEYTEEMELE